MADQSAQEEKEQAGFIEDVLGEGARRWPGAGWFLSLSPDWRVAIASGLLAAVLFLPNLGAVGLWDPWETHYGEVAREMVHRNDYVHPYWENAWFFSKPPFAMWMMALGMLVVGTNRTEGAVALLTEWGMRLPFALFSLAAVVLLSLAISRVVSRRAGLATGFALATMPLYFLLTRQTVTDTPFVSALTCALACAIIGQLDPHTRHRSAWWYGFYVFCAIGLLAKGLLGVGLPAVLLLAYGLLWVLPFDGPSLNDHVTWILDGDFRAQVRRGDRPMPVLWSQLYRMRFGTGLLVFAVIGLPWYVRMFLFEGVDDESQRFWWRFLVHDHLNRLGAGVHTTTPGGAFTYFIEQGGYAIFPWVALLPGALYVAGGLKFRSPAPADHALVIGLLWTVVTFALMALSATKFHHYVFPVLPGVAILIGVYVDRLWTEGVARHAMLLLLGLVLFVLVGKDLASNPKNFTDLFVYNYDRPYPQDLVQRPLSLLAGRVLFTGDLLSLVTLGLGGYMLLEAFLAKERQVSSRAWAIGVVGIGVAVLLATSTRGRVSPTLFVGIALLLVALYVAYEASREDPKTRGGLYSSAVLVGAAGVVFLLLGLRAGPASALRADAADPLLRPLLETVSIKLGLGFAFIVAGALCVFAALARARTALFATFWILAFAFAGWFSWSHWVQLSHHWTQRDQFWRYYEQRRPGEPIASFLMNWRGETFYSRNTVKQIRENQKLTEYANQPGREWALVEHHRLSILRSAVGSSKTVTQIARDLNNKFVLVTID